jgi:hypothetical protein
MRLAPPGAGTALTGVWGLRPPRFGDAAHGVVGTLPAAVWELSHLVVGTAPTGAVCTAATGAGGEYSNRGLGMRQPWGEDCAHLGGGNFGDRGVGIAQAGG